MSGRWYVISPLSMRYTVEPENIVVDLPEDNPPCLFCGEEVLAPSLGGPLVCSWCDCGVNKKDGTVWSLSETRARMKHRRDFLATHEVEGA